MEAESAAAIEFADVASCPTPAPVAIGAPGLGYPMPWLLQTWIPGRIASARGAENGDALALDIAALVQRLRSVDTRGRAFSGHGRGGALPAHDEWIERCLLESAGLLDTKRARVMWEWFRE
jgi:aminoglycoside phosphotransferase (APT) family kinase protein